MINEELQISLSQEVLNSEEQRAYNETLKELLEDNQENLEFFPFLQECANTSNIAKLDLHIEMLKMKQQLVEKEEQMGELQADLQNNSILISDFNLMKTKVESELKQIKAEY